MPMLLGTRRAAVLRAPSLLSLRQLTTRTFVPDTLDATRFETMSHTVHLARASAAGLALVEAGWYIGSSNAEVALGANLIVHASVSKSVSGPWTEITWGGASTGTVLPGTNLRSDVVPFPVTAGDTIYIRRWRQCATGIQYQADTLKGSGDYMQRGTTVTDQVLSNTVINTGVTPQSYPLAIVGYHSGKAIAIIGDSRSYGRNDTIDAANEMGEIARTIGPVFPYINLARRTMSAGQLNASHANRWDLLQYTTDVITNIGINDFINDTRSLAQVQARLQTLWNSIPTGKRIFATTITPYSSATSDAWATVSGQTANGTTTNVVSLNTWIKTLPNSALVAAFDINSPVADASGVWKAPGYTDDGTHGTQVAHLAIKDSGAINTALMAA